MSPNLRLRILQSRSIAFWVGPNSQHVEGRQSAVIVVESQAFPVEFALVLVQVKVPECGYLVVVVGNDRDQKVEEHDHAEELVDEPKQPDQLHHQHFVPQRFALVIGVVPKVITGWRYVSD